MEKMAEALIPIVEQAAKNAKLICEFVDSKFDRVFVLLVIIIAMLVVNIVLLAMIKKALTGGKDAQEKV